MGWLDWIGSRPWWELMGVIYVAGALITAAAIFWSPKAGAAVERKTLDHRIFRSLKND